MRLRRKNLGRGRGGAKPLPLLLFFTDPARTPHPERVIASLPRGAGVVYRTFGAKDALAQGRRLIRLARRRGVVFLVGADVALAVALRADGVHFPERLAGRGGVNRALRARFRVTAAAHGLPAALSARRAGAEAVIASPVFASASVSAGKPMGPLAFTRLVRRAGLPVYALGGVTAATAPRLKASGAIGLAAVEGFSGYGHPNSAITRRAGRWPWLSARWRKWAGPTARAAAGPEG